MASADDLNALIDSLSSWEISGYVAMAAVAAGVAGEVIHEFFDWFKSFVWWRIKGNKASALLLVVALTLEIVIQVKANSISGQIIAFLERETADARERAAKAELETTRLKVLYLVMPGAL